MCVNSGSIPKVEPYKVAKTAAAPPSPTESPSAPESSETVTAKKKNTQKGKLALRSTVSTPSSGVGLNNFS